MGKYLDKIKYPSDLKLLQENELPMLCEEIRELLINTVSKSGGHLAGNLGVVELTVALHRVLNAPKDKIVWDVGHQSYVHKIITGRSERLSTIRTMDGLCGFCNPGESEYDSTYTGHASASLSVATGLAQARNLSGDNYNVAAVIGDGAFTGGLAFEALNNIGNLKSKMLIILNDNEMSIAENVGAFSAMLSRARTNKNYTESKKKLIEKIRKMPGGGEKLMRVLHSIKRRIKSAVAPNMLFEQFGITYLGPVNGHNIAEMEELFTRALALDEPVLVHVITKKGKGYAPAEKLPQVYHGVGPFEKNTGKITKKKDSFSDVFGEKLCEIAKKNQKLIAITPAMIPGSGLSGFSKQFPQRLYDVGIAEGHAVTFAAGMAIGGAVPVVAIYSSFLQRAYDTLI
ncbi:MAG: 1-deoxy-D-xylulose-5-phosphate synthase, partial [Clostridia bacterium]|nr:1-deoxy-D-xylulose-5-phosphate synthase [Clostridia bacterium]